MFYIRKSGIKYLETSRGIAFTAHLLQSDTDVHVGVVENAGQGGWTHIDTMPHFDKMLKDIAKDLGLVGVNLLDYYMDIAEGVKGCDKAEQELNHLSFQSEREAHLQDACATLKKEIGAISYELSQIRHSAAEELAREIGEELSYLNMTGVGFQVALSQFETQDKLALPDGRICAFSKTGIDRAEFLVATNPGEPFKPLVKIASTGETSRLMLAIKSALSKADATPTLIFDEIDMGIGGRTGEVIGKKLSNLSKDHQVICITHLPQVAVFADAHYSVHKDVIGDRTVTTVAALYGKAQLEEISEMLGSLSEPVLESAQDILSKADAWKKS